MYDDNNRLLPQNEFLFEDFRIYQESNDYQTGQAFCVFEEPLLLLNDFEKIDLPIMHLTAGRKRTLDIENYRQEEIGNQNLLLIDKLSIKYFLRLR